jgi:hypothetical protein
VVLDQGELYPVEAAGTWAGTKSQIPRDGMADFWSLLSVNHDLEGQEFVSTLEARDYPFFASQFHPEKNMFEWSPTHPSIPHSRCC